MQLIGFNLTKISAARAEQQQLLNLDTNIEFINLQKQKVEILKESSAIKIEFKYDLVYRNEDKKKEQSNILFEGQIVFAVSEGEETDLLKSWKKKEIPESIKVHLFNLILKKCSPKAVYLADELSLPSPVPLPKITSAKKDN